MSKDNPIDDPNLRLEFFKASQESKPGDKPYDRLASLELTREQKLALFFQQNFHRDENLQGNITTLEGLDTKPDGFLKPLGPGAFVQIYIDEVIGVNRRPKNITQEEYERFWFDQGFKHMGNSDSETKELVLWMQQNPEAVVAFFNKEWGLAEDVTQKLLRLAEKGKLKRIFED